MRRLGVPVAKFVGHSTNSQVPSYLQFFDNKYKYKKLKKFLVLCNQSKTNLLNPSFPENEFQAVVERSRSPGKWQVGHESVTKTIVSLPLVRPS